MPYFGLSDMFQDYAPRRPSYTPGIDTTGDPIHIERQRSATFSDMPHVPGVDDVEVPEVMDPIEERRLRRGLNAGLFAANEENYDPRDIPTPDTSDLRKQYEAERELRHGFAESGGTPFADRRRAQLDTSLSDQATMLRQREMPRTTNPAAPELGVVGRGSRAQFYGGTDGARRVADLSKVQSARDAIGELPKNLAGIREVTTDPAAGEGATTREGEMALRRRSMRQSDEYKNAVAAHKKANEAGFWYDNPGSPSQLETEQITTAYRPAPRAWSQKELDAIERRREERKVEQAMIKDNMKRRQAGLPIDVPLSTRERTQIELGLRRDDEQRLRDQRQGDNLVRLKGMDLASEQLRYNQQQLQMLRADWLNAEEKAQQAEAEARVSRKIEDEEKAKVLRMQANQRRALMQAQIDGSAPSIPSGPSSTGPGGIPRHTGPGGIDEGMPDPQEGLNIARRAAESAPGGNMPGESGRYYQAREYLNTLNTRPGAPITREQYAEGVRLYGAKAMQDAIEARLRKQLHPIAGGLYNWVTGY